MTLKYNIYRPNVSKTYDRLFESILGQMEGLPSTSPSVKYYDLQEKEDHYLIVVPIPGVKKENIDISLTNLRLNVKCKSDLEFGIKEFANSFKVHSGTTEEHVSASYEDGVLRVQVQKVDATTGTVQIPVS